MKHKFVKKTIVFLSIFSMLLGQAVTPVTASVTPDEAEESDSAASFTLSSEASGFEADSALSATETPAVFSSEASDSRTVSFSASEDESADDWTDYEEFSVQTDAQKADDADTIVDGYRIRTITPGECSNTNVAVKESVTSSGATQSYPNLTKILQSYLNEARTQATDTLPTKIIIAPGTYVQSSVLRIYSNTYLSMEGVILINTKSANMLVTGNTTDEVQSGYCYRNITIDGGASGCIWNKNYASGSTTIKVGHAENFKMINCTLTNTLNAHFMEVSGINHFTLQGCSFQNQILETSAKTMTYEAVQFDVLVPEHIKGFTYELLKNQNITVTGCTFTNVARGIGSHNAILNCPLENISITNCTFNNLTSCAIQGMDWKNCTISGNYMTDVPRGITLHSMREDSVFLPSTVAAGSQSSLSLPDTYVAPDLNQNIVISNNTIICFGVDAYVSSYDCSGITLWGITSSGNAATTCDPLPAGNYYISGVTVTGNQIKAASGVVLRDVYNAAISGNSLNCPYAEGTTHYGILSQNGCQNLTFSGNSIKYFPTAGIFCQVGSNYQIADNSIEPQGDGIVFQWVTDSSITGNTINNMGVENPNYGGIRIQYASSARSVDDNKIYNYLGTAALISGGSDVVSLSRNIIEGCRYYGIYLANASVSKLEGNTLTTCGSSTATASYAALTIEAGGKVTSVKNNTITNSRQSGIQIVQGEIAAIANNTITSPAGYGIELNQGTVGSINSNTITKAGNYSIVIYKNASVNSVNKNKISSGSTIGIHIANTASALTVNNNTVKNCQTAQIFINRAKDASAVTLSGNTISSKGKTEDGIRIDSGNVILSKNTIKSCRYAVLFKNTSTVKGSVYPNTFSKNKYNSIRYDGISYKNLTAPASVKAAAVRAKQIQLNWKVAKKVSGYLISRSTKKNTGYKQVGSVSYKKTTYLNKKLKKNKKYYYTVTSYRTTSDGNLTFYSNPSKVVGKKTLK